MFILIFIEKIRHKYVVGILLGYDHQSKAIHVYILTFTKILVSKDVKFDKFKMPIKEYQWIMKLNLSIKIIFGNLQICHIIAKPSQYIMGLLNQNLTKLKAWIFAKGIQQQ